MAIKYTVIPEKKIVVAMLENTQYDAINKIDKIMCDVKFCICSKNYLMPNRFVSVVLCDEHDEFDVEFGKRRAKKIVLDNYDKSMKKRLARFKKDVVAFSEKILDKKPIKEL